MATPAGGTVTRVQPNAFGCITIPFLLVALIPLGYGARSQWSNGTLMREGEVVEGRVIELDYMPGNSSAKNGRGSAVSATVAFTTRTGLPRKMTGSVNRYPAPWSVGDAVEVVYDPVRPERADLKSELDGWKLWLAIWCAVAAVPAVIAMLPMVLFLRQGPAAKSGA
jgi:hypothetical protein